MKRSGFTMIELVFVIVILGILASVAIPKLAATRDDANIAKASTEISAIVSDLGSYYTAHGEFEDNVSKMTNVKLYKASATAGADTVALKTPGTEVYYSDKTRAKDCLAISIDNSDGNLTISPAADAGTPFCKGLNKAVAKLITTHQFGGSSIYN
jgi:general secretion pathway protein G